MAILHWIILGHVPPIAQVTNILSKLIFYSNFIVWLIPPFRQHKGGFFLYFLIVALTDPIGIVIFLIFQINPIYFYAPFAFTLLVVSLWYTNTLKTSTILCHFIVSVFVMIVFIVFKDIRILISLLAYLRIIIFLNIFTYLISKLFYRNILYTYLLFMLFNELTVIAKSFLYLLNVKTSLHLIYLLNLLDFVICIYFIFFNLKNGPRFRIKQKY
jgi:hypothetical protein